MNYEDQLLETAVSEKHPLRKIARIISVKSMVYRIKDLATTLGRKGYGLEVALACLLLQFYYDLTDRQLEERLRHNMAFRWFCGFGITEKTPDHTFFCRARKLIGTKRIGQIFQYINKKAKEAGIMREVFTFVDASAIKAKETTWAERDKALKDGEEKLNNDNVQNYGADKDARFGCKGKTLIPK
ncbi:MAG: transposase [Candidatus Margulisiibacteriota bacterium]